MEDINQNSLEKALAKTEADVDASLKAANAVVNSLKKFRAAIKTGTVRELKKTIESSEQAIAALKQQFSNTKDGWNFGAEDYIGSRAYLEEVLEMAAALGVNIFEQDERLYCYPFLIRIIQSDLAVQIDKTKEKRLRPSTLVTHLKSLQNKPVRFKPEQFLESLFSAYDALRESRGRRGAGNGAVVTLRDIYKLLTLLPGQSRDYSLQEFARDIYLLDRSGVTETKKGCSVTLPGVSSGMRGTSGAIRVITQEGQDKLYYGISFSEAKEA